ncbi:hypothetical protein ACERNI_16220 [Camelimonas sp. ID_303_24]
MNGSGPIANGTADDVSSERREASGIPASGVVTPAAGAGAARRGLSRAEAFSAVGVGVCLGLAGVGAWWAFQPAVNERAASLCRTVIPALNPSDAAFSLAAPRPGASRSSVRIAYTAQTADGRLRHREVSCRYAASEDGARVRLTGVATERGPLAEANFYFLRRFYLEASDGPPPDPAASQAVAPRP